MTPSMNGEMLWALFLGGEVPDAELIALGEDAGMMEARPRAPAQQALLKICLRAARENGDTILFTPSQLYDALRYAMPDSRLVRRGLLHAVADEYEKRKPFLSVYPDVRSFIGDVATALGSTMSRAAPAAAMAGK